MARSIETQHNWDFTDRLNELMLSNNLNCVQVARSCGLDRKTIYSYRDGASIPNINTLIDLCELFDVSADYLLFGKK